MSRGYFRVVFARNTQETDPIPAGNPCGISFPSTYPSPPPSPPLPPPALLPLHLHHRPLPHNYPDSLAVTPTRSIRDGCSQIDLLRSRPRSNPCRRRRVSWS